MRFVLDIDERGFREEGFWRCVDFWRTIGILEKLSDKPCVYSYGFFLGMIS